VLTRRIIACLDVDGGRVVKGTRFVDLRDAGDCAELAARHQADGIDEIVLLDISATRANRGTLLESVRRTARELFIPFMVGGGIRRWEDAAAALDAGADKISINSAAVQRPELLTELASRFGSQAVVVAIDAMSGNGTAEVAIAGGTTRTGKDVLTWALEAESRGAGEILLTSMAQDGTRDGFDCELTKRVSTAVSIPVIASGGAGKAEDFVAVFNEGAADAALAASIFHSGEITPRALKQHLRAAGTAMRWPC
jgi:imidazole glycerol-phosphate synthase subunit HisF